MKFIVSINYLEFKFDDLTAAANFSMRAKESIIDERDPRIRIDLVDDEEQNDNEQEEA